MASSLHSGVWHRLLGQSDAKLPLPRTRDQASGTVCRVQSDAKLSPPVPAAAGRDRGLSRQLMPGDRQQTFDPLPSACHDLLCGQAAAGRGKRASFCLQLYAWSLEIASLYRFYVSLRLDPNQWIPYEFLHS